MSKHPLDIPPGRKLSREEVMDALRLAIIAELDAINLYLQIARSVDDENVKKVFEDIAKEEKTHVGEFLALLKHFDREQVEELKAGAKEVEELTGIKAADPQPAELGSGNGGIDELTKYVADYVKRSADAIRKFRRFLTVRRLGRGAEAVLLERSDGGRSVVPLEEISVKFYVSQRALDYAALYKTQPDVPQAYAAASELAFREDSFIASQLISCKDAQSASMRSWDQPGEAVEDVAKALSMILKSGVNGKIVLFVSPDRYVKLVSVHERTGVMELTRLKSLVNDVVAVPSLSYNTAILMSVDEGVADIVLGGDTEVDYIGPEDGRHVFRLWESIAVRVKNPKGIVVLRGE